MISPTPRTLYTLGYQKRTLEEFISILESEGISVLIDIRETPWSHKPGFSGTTLKTALEEQGIGYVHAKFAGNPKWLRARARSHAECLEGYMRYLNESDGIIEAFDALVESLHSKGNKVCITCFERHADDCHRSILSTKWREKGARVVKHLATE